MTALEGEDLRYHRWPPWDRLAAAKRFVAEGQRDANGRERVRRRDGAGEPRLKQEPPSHTNTFSIPDFPRTDCALVNAGRISRIQAARESPKTGQR